ncbi:IclR family transcriptional regulator domain-containing protein [Streptomyces sp. INA 01156]
MGHRPARTRAHRAAADRLPYLHDLYGATLATVHLAVRDGLRALYVDRLSGHASVPVVSAIGSRLPLHATGVGKVLLAHARPPSRRRCSPTSPGSPLHGEPAGTAARPAREGPRERLRHDGGGDEPGACTVAVPIRSDGAVVAALGIVAPSLRRDRARLVSALQVAARGIGRSLTGQVAH